MNPFDHLIVLLFTSILAVKSFNINKVIPENYDQTVPPMVDGKPTPVKVHITLRSAYHESKDIYNIDLFLALTWQEPRLNLTTFATSNKTSYTLPSEAHSKIWQPRVFLSNAMDTSILEHPHQTDFIWVFKDNYLVHMIKLTVKQRCSSKDIPPVNDRNLKTLSNCILELESLTDSVSEMKLMWDKNKPFVVDADFFGVPIDNKEKFELQSFNKKYGKRKFSCANVFLPPFIKRDESNSEMEESISSKFSNP